MPSSVSNKCQLVRQTCKFVMERAKHVKINHQNIYKLAEKFEYKKFNDYEHHNVGEKDETILMYLFVLDSCNFCFWPLQGFEYEQLASNIQQYIMKGRTLQQLSNINQAQLISKMFNGIEVPLARQRARLIREVASVVAEKFQGSFTKVVQLGNKSALKLLNILTENFPNFQDHQIYEGHQIHFYKRAQILIAGIWGRYEGKGLGQFTDIKEITMFADYRVPQILNEYGILTYGQSLNQKIHSKQQLVSGCKEQVQLRAATIIAVELIKEFINAKKDPQNHALTLQVDHYLWQLGQSMLDKGIVPHHRTLTIYY